MGFHSNVLLDEHRPSSRVLSAHASPLHGITRWVCVGTGRPCCEVALCTIGYGVLDISCEHIDDGLLRVSLCASLLFRTTRHCRGGIVLLWSLCTSMRSGD